MYGMDLRKDIPNYKTMMQSGTVFKCDTTKVVSYSYGIQ